MRLSLARRGDDVVHAVCLDDDGAVGIEDDEVARGRSRRRRRRRVCPAARRAPSSLPGRGRSAPRSAARARAARRGPARRRRPASRRRPDRAPASRAGRRPRRPATGRASSARARHRAPRARRPRAPSGCRRCRRARSWPARHARPGHDLHEREVDQARLALGLVDRRDAEPGQLLDLRHSASTTWGISRWNASAYRISERPEMRRAWFARCPARSV